MRMCYCCLYQPWPILIIPVMVGSKITDQAMRIITKKELTKVTTTWKQTHFGAVMSETLQLSHWFIWNQSGKGGDPFLSKGWHCEGEGILPWGCPSPSPHHTEGHHPPIWYSKCTQQYQCQKTLYMCPCAHGTDTQSTVAYSSDGDCDLLRATSGVLSGTHLSVQFECSFHQNPHKDCGWPGCDCQPCTAGGPPNRNFRGVQ